MKLFSSKKKTGKNPANLKPKRHLLSQMGRDPYYDWAIIVSVSFVAAVIVIVVGVFTYLDIDAKLTETPPSAGATAAAINLETLSRILGQFDSRATEHQNLIRGFSGVADPSI